MVCRRAVREPSWRTHSPCEAIPLRRIMAKLAFRPPKDPIRSSTTNVEQMPMIEVDDQTRQSRAKVLRRRRRCAIFLALVAIVAAALTFMSLSQDPFHQCDKQCRSAYGFYDRSITGARIGVFGQRCACHRAGEPLGEEQPWRSHKPWNESFWCGDFSTSLVCATEPAAGEVESLSATVTRSEAQLRGLTILHCGACAACSTLHDLDVLNASKAFATVSITKCATAFAKPTWLGGHRDKDKLAACLVDAGIGFSQDGSAWAQPADKPTCMDCWTGAATAAQPALPPPTPQQALARVHAPPRTPPAPPAQPSIPPRASAFPAAPRRQRRVRRGGVREQPRLHPPLLRPLWHELRRLHQVRRAELRARVHPLCRRQPPLERHPLRHLPPRPAGLPRRILVAAAAADG